MKRQRFSVILIFIMVITPVASAFGQCSGISLRGHLPESQGLIVAGIVDNSSTSKHQEAGPELYQNQAKMQCHTGGSCTFHICGGCGMAASTLFSNFIASYSYSSFESTLPYSTTFSPEIRPPILIL